ncbi:hypothetical protein FISHEDRAFT_58127 [Fistulina hepatica ATCC 64428]|nr:hypothetical protein FISHEDRAFT_58127 [Fistulina hepatica ATCC 64428]
MSTSGNAPPALMNAAMGYDETSRNLIIFGGESSGGFPQSDTYLLDMNTLVWSSPDPPSTLQDSPPARSAPIFGSDFAASYRQGFVVVGGKSSDDSVVSDVWEFDYTNQFWSEITVTNGGPARWGASGGIDIRVDPVQDPTLSAPNNTIYLSGGYNGSKLFDLSNAWRLNISGTLSSNLPNDTYASWEQLDVSADLPSLLYEGGTMVEEKIVSISGTNSTTDATQYALQGSYVLDTTTGQAISPSGCPAPRLGPVVVPNMNSYSTGYVSQTFLLLGTYNSSLWDDGGALEKGEVAILDSSAGTWTCVIPAGDPGTSGTETYPGPREGAVGMSYTKGLVGGSRSNYADTIVFGGRNASGEYLSDLWILRAYSGSVSSSSDEWSGYGNGTLETGVNATGTGVKLTFLSSCATALSSTSSSKTGSSPTSTSTSASSGSSSASSGPTYEYDTAVYHKVLGAVSVGLFLPATLGFRLVSPSYANTPVIGGVLLVSAVGLSAYLLGVAGLVTAFTSLTLSSSSLSKRSGDSISHLKTAHGRAGLALSVALFVIVPVIVLATLWSKHRENRADLQSEGDIGDKRLRQSKDGAAEKGSASAMLLGGPGSPTQSVRSSEPRSRTQSFSQLLNNNANRPSSDSDRSAPPAPKSSFVVVNRGQRRRHSSLSNDLGRAPTPRMLSRTLGEMDWLQRRRSLNTVGELDYAITQAIRTQEATPNTVDALIPAQDIHLIEFPSKYEIVIRLLFHAILFALCIFCLFALWHRASVAAFAVFLAWTVIFYALIFVMSWYSRPSRSLLSAILFRLRSSRAQLVPTIPTANANGYVSVRAPYLNQPRFRRATPQQDDPVYAMSPRSVDDDGDEEDEETQQLRMEAEMERRHVSIVTVPKPRLWVTNPSV